MAWCCGTFRGKIKCLKRGTKKVTFRVDGVGIQLSLKRSLKEQNRKVLLWEDKGLATAEAQESIENPELFSYTLNNIQGTSQKVLRKRTSECGGLEQWGKEFRLHAAGSGEPWKLFELGSVVIKAALGGIRVVVVDNGQGMGETRGREADGRVLTLVQWGIRKTKKEVGVGRYAGVEK